MNEYSDKLRKREFYPTKCPHCGSKVINCLECGAPLAASKLRQRTGLCLHCFNVARRGASEYSHIDHPLYARWIKMKRTGKNTGVCKEWRSDFPAFVNWWKQYDPDFVLWMTRLNEQGMWEPANMALMKASSFYTYRRLKGDKRAYFVEDNNVITKGTSNAREE